MWPNLGHYRLKGGTSALLEKMHEDGVAELKLGTVVKRVVQSDGWVTVTTTRNETYRARTAIFALPLNVIADIDFEPSISSIKLNASKQRHTGSGSKVYMRTKGKHPLMFAQGRQDMPFNFYWTEYDDVESQMMAGFNISPDLLDVNDEEEIHKAVLAFPGIRKPHQREAVICFLQKSR